MRFQFVDNGEFPVSGWWARGVVGGDVVAEAHGVNKPCGIDKNGMVIDRDRDGSILRWKIHDAEYVGEFMSQLKGKFTEMTWVLGPDQLDRQLLLKQHGWKCRCINIQGEYVFGWRADGKDDGFAVWRDGSFDFMVLPEA